MALFHHRALGSTNGDIWSFGLYTSGLGTLDSAQATWNLAIGDLWAGITGIVCADVTVDELTTASITEATGGQISKRSTGSALAGTSAAECMPFQCSVAVSFTTDLATRGGRGRFYLPPLDVTTLDGGRLSAAARTTIVTSVNQLWAELDTGGLAIQIYSRSLHTLTPVTGGSVGDVIDTQRRRRNKLQEQRASLTAP
jgi:hypothetical protein